MMSQLFGQSITKLLIWQNTQNVDVTFGSLTAMDFFGVFWHFVNKG